MSTRYAGFECLRVEIDQGVAFVTIDHPPINLFDVQLVREIDNLSRQVATDDGVVAVVLKSANPEFFIAHADVALILRMPTDSAPPTELTFFHTMIERWRTMPKATIAVIEGRAGGGGSELALSMDMRFAALGRAVLSQPEVALGILPGGSGTQRLAGLMGRSRALEAVLGCDDFPAAIAERYGWINRALPPEEVGPFVDRLARRIASFPPGAVARAKEAVLAAQPSPVPGLLEEARLFTETLGLPGTRQRMERFLELGGQTREGELDLQSLVERVSRPR